LDYSATALSGKYIGLTILPEEIDIKQTSCILVVGFIALPASSAVPTTKIDALGVRLA
jgi:hypothetical protein